MTFIFPAHVLTPASVGCALSGVSLDGGEALSGESDVIETDGGGRWRVTYDGIEVRTPTQARVWNAWLAFMGQGTQKFLVPMLSLATAPRAMTGMAHRRVSPLVADDDEWPTSLAYTLPEHSARVVAPADARATTLYLDATKGPSPHSGAFFSLADGRAYIVLRDEGGGAYAIRPPLRGAVAADAAATFDFPLMLCSLEPGQDFSSPLGRGFIGSVGLVFREATP